MNIEAWAWASLAATAALTITMAGSQHLGLTRMSLTLMLGTVFTPNRDRAMLVGTLLHFISGAAFGALYAGFFEWLGRTSFWLGGLMGAVHGALVLLVLFPVLPALHPRMATENHGPDPTRGLEPPGFFGANYGYPTPVLTFLGHLAYGAVWGALYQMAG